MFYVQYTGGDGNPRFNPPNVLEVKNEEAFEMPTGRRITGMQLFAVPRADLVKLRKKDPLDWLKAETPGVLSADLAPPSTTASKKSPEVPITPYRVSLEKGKLKVNNLPDENKRGAAPANRLHHAVAGAVRPLVRKASQNIKLRRLHCNQ